MNYRMMNDDELQRSIDRMQRELQAASAAPGSIGKEKVAELLRESNLALDEVEARATGQRQPVTGGFPSQQPTDRLSGDERCYRIGRHLQAVAAASMPPGDRVGEFHTGRVAEELRASGQIEAQPSLGGFLVGGDMATSIFQKMQKYGQLLSRCRQVPLSGNSNKLEWPTVDETSRIDGARYGGVRGYWAAEAATLTASAFKFGKLELSLNKVHCLAYSSSELLQDAAALGSFVEEAFSNELVFKIEDALVNGSGTGQPLGFMNNAALIPVTAASSAGTLVAADLVSMFARFWASSQDNAIFIANQDIIPQLLVLNTDVTFAGQGAPLFFPSMTRDPVMRLFGKPILFLEQCASLGTRGDIVLIDPTQILVATKGGLSFAQSAHVQFVTDELAFRGTFRVDAQPMWSSALTPFKGSNTQSPFVCVETRT